MPPGEPDRERLLDRLTERGFLEEGSLASALRTVPREIFVPSVCTPLADVDVPVPLVDPTLEAAPCPSPRVAVTLLRALDVQPGHQVRVEGEGIAWIAALAAQLADGGTVLVVERDLDLRERLETRGFPVEIDGLQPAGGERLGQRAFDRVLATGPRSPDSLPVDRLSDDGQLVAVVPGAEIREGSKRARGLELLRVLQSEGEQAQMQLGGLHVADQPEGLDRPEGRRRRTTGGRSGPSGDGADRMTVHQLLQTELLLADAWTRRGVGDPAEELRASVEETIGRALEARGIRAQQPARARAAWGAFHLGYVHQMTGEFHNAVDAYTASAAIVPSAEAYTFRGWATSFLGDLHAAIDDCKKAIDTDPALGNPYNDIGAYLLELDRPREAVEWLEDATEAERYPSRQFPYLNLGRAYLDLGEETQARDALEQALEIDPDCEPARRLLRRIERGGSSRGEDL